MIKRLIEKFRVFPLKRKVAVINIILLFLVVAVIAMYFFDYYPVVELSNKVFG